MLQSVGSQSVRHNLATVQQQQICGFPVGSVVKNTPTNAGDTGLSPGLERSLEKQWQPTSVYPCPGICMDRGAWTAPVCTVEHNSTQTNRLESFCKNMLIGMSHFFPFLLSCYSDLVLIFI